MGEVLGTRENNERNVLLASLGFCRMVRWREGDSKTMRMPLTATLEPLCEGFAALRPLAPALRLVGDDSLFVAGIAVAGSVSTCGVAAAFAGGRFHATPAAIVTVR